MMRSSASRLMRSFPIRPSSFPIAECAGSGLAAARAGRRGCRKSAIFSMKPLNKSIGIGKIVGRVVLRRDFVDGLPDSAAEIAAGSCR